MFAVSKDFISKKWHKMFWKKTNDFFAIQIKGNLKRKKSLDSKMLFQSNFHIIKRRRLSARKLIRFGRKIYAEDWTLVKKTAPSYRTSRFWGRGTSYFPLSIIPGAKICSSVPFKHLFDNFISAFFYCRSRGEKYNNKSENSSRYIFHFTLLPRVELNFRAQKSDKTSRKCMSTGA